MQYHMGPIELTPPAQPFADAGVVQSFGLPQFEKLMRSSFAPGPGPHSAANALLTTQSAADELDRWSLVEECYREHMARRELEELFASGEMWPFEY
jgi:hypothetical protein